MSEFRKFSKTLFDYFKIKLGFGVMPKNIMFLVTNECNLKCRACGTKELNPHAKRDERLSIDEIREFFNELGNLDSVCLTGGEPTNNDNLSEIASCVNADNIIIQTNGYNTKLIVEIVKEILSSDNFKQLVIQVSVDGIGKTHDSVRRTVGSYKRALRTIQELKRIMDNRLIIMISNTIRKSNINDTLEVYKLSKSLGVGFTTRLCHSSFGKDEDVLYNVESKSLCVDENTKKKLFEIFSTLEKECSDNQFYRYYKKFLTNPSEQVIPCLVPEVNLWVFHQGDVRLCHSFGNISSIKESGIREMLKSKKARNIKKMVKNGACSCWIECNYNNSFYSNPIEMLKTRLKIG